MSHPCQPIDAAVQNSGVAVPVSTQTTKPRQKRDLLTWQQAVVAMGRRAIVSPEPAILMHDAGALVAEMLDVEHSGTAEICGDGAVLCHRLTLRGTTAEPRETSYESGLAPGDSMAGYVLHMAHPVVVGDLAQEQRFQDLRLREHGIRSAIAAPLILPERSFGVLAAFSSRPSEFDKEDMLLAETIAHLATTTIARQKAEEALAAQKRLSMGVFQLSSSMALVLDAQGQILSANPACEHVTGFSEKELIGRPIFGLFPETQESGAFRQLLLHPPEGEPSVQCENTLLTKDSQRRRVAWSFHRISSGDANREAMVVVGDDCTQESAPADASKVVGAFGNMPVGPHGDRRRRPRRSYPYSQRIAPIIEGKLPGRDTFVEVQCNDIAAGGFSYVSPAPPASDMLVVALGAPPNLTYLTVQVAHVNRIKNNGQRMFLVGCNYVGRANY